MQTEPAPELYEPENLLPVLKSFTTGVIFDGSPAGYSFGSVIDDARVNYKMVNYQTIYLLYTVHRFTFFVF